MSHFFPWKWKIYCGGGFSDICMEFFFFFFQCDFHLWTDDSSDVTYDPHSSGQKEPALREPAGWNGMCRPGNHVTSPARISFSFSLNHKQKD